MSGSATANTGLRNWWPFTGTTGLARNITKPTAGRICSKDLVHQKAEEAVKFVKSFHSKPHLLLRNQPRPRALRTDSEVEERARDTDIELVMNSYLDIDPVGQPSNEQIAELELFLGKQKPISKI